MIPSKSLSDTIRNLKEATNEVAKGNFNVNVPADSSSEINELVKSFNLMSESLKKRTQVMVTAERKYRNLYDQSLDMCRIVNADSIILECNKAYEENLGYTREEIIGKTIFEHDAEESIADHHKMIETWRKEGKVLNVELWFKRKDGSKFPVILSSNGVFDEEGKLVASNTIIRDITEIHDARKKIQESEAIIKKQLEELKQADELKSQFASMVTHELKTPLVPIKGYCEMLKEPGLMGELNAEQKDAVLLIHQSAIRLEGLIADVLDSQKLDMGKMKFTKENFRVDEIMSLMIKDLSSMMKDKQIEYVNLTKDASVVNADKNRIYQVLRNLIGNAVDFVPLKGRIEICAQSNDGEVLFYCKDNGLGIPKEKQGSLFKKFYQVDTSATRKHGGTGLGLAICKGIVEGLGGRIWLESDAGKGSTFYFTLPKTS